MYKQLVNDYFNPFSPKFKNGIVNIKQENTIEQLFTKYGIVCKNNCSICEECNCRYKKETLVINQKQKLTVKVVVGSDQVIKTVNLLFGKIYQHPYPKKHPLSEEVLYPRKPKCKLRIDLLSDQQCRELCRLPKLAMYVLADVCKLSFAQVMLYFMYWAQDSTFRVLGSLFVQKKTTIATYVEKTTERLYEVVAKPFFEETVTREWVKKHTTLFSRKILNLMNPDSCILVIDGWSIPVSKPRYVIYLFYLLYILNIFIIFVIFYRQQ